MERDKRNILIVEDDEQINDAIKIYLSKEGYHTLQAYDGKDALNQFILELVDLIILDIMLPEMDGKEVLRQVRAVSDVPVIMLTALSREYDKLRSFQLGADDYVVKPFSPKEVIARVNAVLNRVNRIQKAYIHVGDISINPFTREVFAGDHEILLTKKEFDLLYILANNPNMTFSRETLLGKIWGNKDVTDERTVDTHVKQLREKLGSRKGYIQTVWGVGYRLQVKKHE